MCQTHKSSQKWNKVQILLNKNLETKLKSQIGLHLKQYTQLKQHEQPKQLKQHKQVKQLKQLRVWHLSSDGRLYH